MTETVPVAARALAELEADFIPKLAQWLIYYSLKEGLPTNLVDIGNCLRKGVSIDRIQQQVAIEKGLIREKHDWDGIL